MKFSVDPWDRRVRHERRARRVGAGGARSSTDVEVPPGEWRPSMRLVGPDADCCRVRRRRAPHRGTDLDRRAIAACRDLRVVRRGSGAMRRGGPRSSTSRSHAACSHRTDGLATSSPTRRSSSRAARRTRRRAALMLAVHERMAECEVRSPSARAAATELILLDGPLRKAHAHRPCGRVHQDATHVRYLPEELHRIVGTLAAGQRTPVFTIDARPFSRHAWYLRLPGPSGWPWAGIVRCEATGRSPPEARGARRHRDARRCPGSRPSPTRTPGRRRTCTRSAASSVSFDTGLGDAAAAVPCAPRAASSSRVVSPA